MSHFSCRPVHFSDWPEVLRLVTQVVVTTYGDASPALRSSLAEGASGLKLHQTRTCGVLLTSLARLRP